MTERYIVSAYSCTDFVRLVDVIQTDYEKEVLEFIYKHCQNGLNCEVVDHEASTHYWAYAKDWSEDGVTLFPEQ